MNISTVLLRVFVGLLLGTSSVLYPSLVVASSEQLAAMKWVKKTSSIDIENVIKPTLFRVFTKKELLIAREIDIDVVLDERFSRVRAFNYRGGKKIEISTGFLSLIAALADAEYMAIKYKKEMDIEKYFWIIQNYINSYYEKSLSERGIKWPDPFYKYSGIPEAVYFRETQSKEYWDAFSLIMRNTISYVVAHEYAHHIFSHVDKQPRNAEESRINEDEADDFSIRVNWNIGNSPFSIMKYFILFTMVEGHLHQGTHAPSACRLEKFFDAGIKYEEAELRYYDPATRKQLKIYFEKVKERYPPLRKACEEGGVLTNSTIPIL